MPIRVELSHLMIIDGYYFLNNVLFTGLAYDHRDEQLHKVYQISDGKISAENDYGFFERPGFIKLDYHVIDDFYEPEFGEAMIYQGKQFNGITYEYRDGFVWGESLFVNGYVVESISWYPDGSGLVRFYETDYDEHRCKFEWHYKQLISAEVTKNPYKDEIGFSLNINDKNKINSCVLYGDNVAHLGQLVGRAGLPLPATLTELLNCYAISTHIFLNINNEVNFNYFINNTAFQSIKTLKLETEHLSLQSLAPLMDLPNLQEIHFHEAGIINYTLQKMHEQERQLKQQQCDNRNHALLTFLFAIQAKQHSKIRLYASSGLLFVYSYDNNGEGKVLADVNQCDFDYLLKTLPLERITELELRQSNLPIASLQKLVKFSHLKRLSLKENSIYDYSHTELDDEAKAIAQRQSDKRNQALWSLLINLQAQLHCDIKLISQSLDEFEQPYRG